MWKLCALLVSLAVSCLATSKVEQITVAYAADPSQVYVSFAAITDETKAEVKYGTSPDNLDQSVSFSGATYSVLKYTSPMLFKGILPNLKVGNTVYYYSIGSETLGYSEVNSFKTHPGVGAKDVTFHIFGDLGQTNNSVTTLNELISFESALTTPSGGIVSMGDLSYANGDQPQWDTFGNMVTAASGHIPMLSTQGNHEWFDTPNHDFRAYLSRFSNPLVDGKQELYYSFDSGLVHFVMVAGYCQQMISTLTQPCLAEGSPEMDWLVKDLSSVDRAVTPWVVAVFHQPYVNSNTAHSIDTEGAPMQQAVEEVLNTYHVDLVFSGHVHAYERSCQVYHYKCQAGAPWYITIGDGGNAEGLASTWVEPQPEWSEFRQASYGFGELRAVNSTSMEWRWHQNQDLLPTIADSYTFTKDQGERKYQQGQGKQGQGKTGLPVFADSERGRVAATFNQQQTKLSARNTAAGKH